MRQNEGYMLNGNLSIPAYAPVVHAEGHGQRVKRRFGQGIETFRATERVFYPVGNVVVVRRHRIYEGVRRNAHLLGKLFKRVGHVD